MARATTRTNRGKATRPAGTSVKAAAPRTSKDELRAQVEKLQRANVNLRAKNRELKRAADEAQDRVGELERELSRHERRAARAAAPDRAASKPARRGGRSRQESGRDPGDAVPPGVAVEEPEPISEQDRRVLEHLDEELSPD